MNNKSNQRIIVIILFILLLLFTTFTMSKYLINGNINANISFLASTKKLTGWQKIKGSWYYYNNKGVIQKGWQKIKNSWYYLVRC